MKHFVLGFLLFGGGVSALRAGDVIPLANTPEATGKLTFTGTAIRVETDSSPTEINFPDVLEADFGDAPFQLDFFNGDTAAQLPATWKKQDIGMASKPGSVTVANGTWTVSGGGVSPIKKPLRTSDNLFFAGQPWTGDGQWTARIKDIDAKVAETMAGLMLRDTLDAGSAMFSLEANGPGNSGYGFRLDTGQNWGRAPIAMDIPVWLRMTRYGTSIFGSISTDGKTWDLVGLAAFKSLANPWIGFFVDSHRDDVLGKAVFDQVSLTPPPSSAEMIPPGVLLNGGSFLAGTFDRLATDPANPDAPGIFRRNGKAIPIPRSKIAAIIMLPLARSQFAAAATHVGFLMKNGDVMDGDFDSINSNSVLVSSVLLGITTYNRSEVSACILRGPQTQPASYEIRLRDGSRICANGISLGNQLTEWNKGKLLGKDGQGLIMEDASGLNLDATIDEVAQFRAGSSQVQSLAELDWKAASGSAAPAAANAAPDQVPSVQGWEGKNQEQILEAPVGTVLTFPLTGRFRAMAMRIALSPASPPNSQVTVRIMADGREIGRTPPFKAGDQPRFMEITLQDPKTVTLQADSIFAGTKVLFIDPVAIRDK